MIVLKFNQASKNSQMCCLITGIASFIPPDQSIINTDLCLFHHKSLYSKPQNKERKLKFELLWIQ